MGIHHRTPFRDRRERRPHRLAALALSAAAAFGAPDVRAAAFEPGQAEADPPTGDTGASRPGGDEPAGGTGIRWAIAPWRYRGTAGLDVRWIKLDTGRRETQVLARTDTEFASFVWQPWFIQLRAGLGLLGGRDWSRSAETPPESNGVIGVTGRAEVRVFPASRFPFGLRVEVGDSRASGETLVNDYRTLRIGITQAYRPVTGRENYTFSLDHSRVRATEGASDTLTTVQAAAVRQWAENDLDVSASYSLNARSDTEDRARNWSLNARHTYHPDSAFSAESAASWAKQRLTADRSLGGLDLGVEVRQVSAIGNWRPRPGDWLYSATAPATAVATARVVETATGDASASGRSRSLALSAGLTKELSPELRSNAALSYSTTQTRNSSSTFDATTLTGSVSWVPPGVALGSWRYTPSLGVNGALQTTSGQGGQQILGLQGSHNIGRSWPFEGGHSVSLNVAQSAGTVQQFPANDASRGLSHTLGLYWQIGSDVQTQSFINFIASDSRTYGETDGTFQFVNLQLSRRTQLSRYQGWSANLTLQASRSDTEVLDPFTGQVRPQSNGWEKYYSGSVSYESQRVFGVPRLRFTALLNTTSQQFDRRAAGDIDAPLEQVTHSAEARLDYSIGRLDSRLSARVARVDGRTVASIAARIQRRF